MKTLQLHQLQFNRVADKVERLVRSREGIRDWIQAEPLTEQLTGMLLYGARRLDLHTADVIEFIDIAIDSKCKDMPVNKYFTWADIAPKELVTHALFSEIEYRVMQLKPGATGPGEVASCLFNRDSVYHAAALPGDLKWNKWLSEYKQCYVTGFKGCNNLCSPEKFDEYTNKDNIDRLVGIATSPKRPSLFMCADLKKGHWSDVFKFKTSLSIPYALKCNLDDLVVAR